MLIKQNYSEDCTLRVRPKMFEANENMRVNADVPSETTVMKQPVLNAESTERRQQDGTHFTTSPAREELKTASVVDT